MKFILYISSTIFMKFSFGQNLVPNHSFEVSDSCPITSINSFTNINHCENWFHTIDTWTVDFYHPCMPAPFFDPPSLFGGMHSNAHDQEAFLGLVFFALNANVREIASVSLKTSLIKDSLYCFSMFYKNGELNNNSYGIDNIGIYCSVDTIKYNEIRDSSANIRTPEGEIQISTDWKELSGVFKANGGEKFLNIGNFGGDSETLGFYTGASPSGFESAYYLIDYIELKPCSINYVYRIDIPNVFTPNGDNINDLLFIDYGFFTELKAVVINRWGKEINNYDALAEVWDGTNKQGNEVSEGVYYIVVQGLSEEGELFSESQTVSLFR